MVGKSDFKENSKSDLDLDLGFVKSCQFQQDKKVSIESAYKKYLVNKTLSIEIQKCMQKFSTVIAHTIDFINIPLSCWQKQ